APLPYDIQFAITSKGQSTELKPSPSYGIGMTIKAQTSDGKNVLTLANANREVVSLDLPSTGGWSATGRLKVAADLKEVNDLLRAFNASMGATDGVGQLKRGSLSGEIDVARAANGDLQVSSDLALSNLDVTTADAAKPIRDEKVAVSLTMSAQNQWT